MLAGRVGRELPTRTGSQNAVRPWVVELPGPGVESRRKDIQRLWPGIPLEVFVIARTCDYDGFEEAGLRVITIDGS
ncbi:hypothetical protein GCM10010166_11010 [Couchioplanes caeruleus subsp. azureus]|nr:hypothetical protein GCM10010166_11010 [Couchioplanes caeruleus subsp. azureus]